MGTTQSKINYLSKQKNRNTYICEICEQIIECDHYTCIVCNTYFHENCYNLISDKKDRYIRCPMSNCREKNSINKKTPIFI